MRIRLPLRTAAVLVAPLILLFGLGETVDSSARTLASQTHQDNASVITLQPTIPPTAATVPLSTTTTTTIEPPLPTLPTTTRPSTSIGPPIPTTTIVPYGPPLPPPLSFGDPTLMPVCQSVLPPGSPIAPTTTTKVPSGTDGTSATTTTTTTNHNHDARADHHDDDTSSAGHELPDRCVLRQPAVEAYGGARAVSRR